MANPSRDIVSQITVTVEDKLRNRVVASRAANVWIEPNVEQIVNFYMPDVFACSSYSNEQNPSNWNWYISNVRAVSIALR